MAAVADEDVPSGSPQPARVVVKRTERVKSGGLEDELAALLAGAAAVTAGTKDAQNQVHRARRKSRELDSQLGDLTDICKSIGGAASVMRSLSDGVDLDDDAALRAAFDEIDLDKGGTIDRDELMQAFKKANPEATEEALNDMMNFVDKDGDGEITFEEYKQIMRTKA